MRCEDCSGTLLQLTTLTGLKNVDAGSGIRPFVPYSGRIGLVEKVEEVLEMKLSETSLLGTGVTCTILYAM